MKRPNNRTEDWLGLKDIFLQALYCYRPEILEGTCHSERSRITIRRIFGQGSTSRQFLIYIQGGMNGGRKFFLKQYTSQEHTQTFWENQLTRELFVGQLLNEKLRSSAWFGVPRPYVIIPEEMALATEFVDGLSLQGFFFRALRFSRLLCPRLNYLDGIARRIGSGLAKLQEIPVSELESALGRPSLDDYLERFFRLFEEAEEYFDRMGYFPDLVKRGRQALKELVVKSKLTSSICYLHCDFVPRNFIIDQNGDLNLFDFANATIGPGYFDAAHFASSIEDFSYLKSVSQKCVQTTIRSFLLALGAPQRFDSVLFDAFKVFVQFRSTMIILKAEKHQHSLFRRLFHENALKRFNHRVGNLLKGIEEGKGELNYLSGG